MKGIHDEMAERGVEIREWMNREKWRLGIGDVIDVSKSIYRQSARTHTYISCLTCVS
jgi:hypothetical protein